MDIYGEDKNYEANVSDPYGMETRLGREEGVVSLSVVPGQNILDFGCASGINYCRLRSARANVVGIDRDEAVIRAATDKYPLGTFVHYDGVHLADALKGIKIDGILATFSFCTIKSEDLLPLMIQMREILPKGGRLTIVEPNFEKALGRTYPGLKYHPQPGVKSGDFVRVTLGEGETATELYHDVYRVHADHRRLFKEAGFCIDEFREPRPRRVIEKVRWWQAVLVSPYLVISAT